jgi:hypothetical protein
MEEKTLSSEMEQKATQMWTVKVEQDPDTGELVLPLPADLLSQMGWIEGTDLFWEETDGKGFILTDKKPEVSDSDTDVGC